MEAGDSLVAAPAEHSSFNREEVVKLARANLNFLASLVMPLQFKVFFPALHFTVWKLLLDKLAETEIRSPTPQQKFPQVAIGWPRGFAKTTLVKLFVLWCIFFSNKKFILVVAGNAPKAQNILADVCDMLSEPNILNLFGNWKAAISIDRVDLKKFSFMGREIVIAALGSQGDPRGINIGNERPDIMVMDDMQSRENSKSPAQAKELLTWMTATLAKAKSPGGCIFIYIGNMFSSPGCILKILRNNSNWLSVIVAGILADGSTLWPEFRSKEELLDELKNDVAMGTPEVFFSEIMNDDKAGVTSCFDITKVPEAPFSSQTDIVAASFIIIDVATDKIGADDTSITRYEVFDGLPVAVELEVGIFSPGKTIELALTMCLKTGCPLIAVESVAYQSTFLYWFDKTITDLGIEGIHLVELFPKGRSKNSRILTMFKALLGSFDVASRSNKNPTLYLATAVRPKVFWQISQFDPTKTKNVDDILDNLAYCADVMQDYAGLIWHPLTQEYIAFENSKVIEHNSAF